MRKLHGDHALGLKKEFHPGDEIVQIRDMRENVVSQEKIGALSAARQLAREASTKESCDRGDAFADSDLTDVSGRFDTQHRNPSCFKVLQEIAIVTGQFQHERARAKSEPAGD